MLILKKTNFVSPFLLEKGRLKEKFDLKRFPGRDKPWSPALKYSNEFARNSKTIFPEIRGIILSSLTK